MALWIPLDKLSQSDAPRPILGVELRCDDKARHAWISFKFTVDTGSDFTVIPIEWVGEYNLALNLIGDGAGILRSFLTSSGSTAFGFRGNVQLRLKNIVSSWPCIYSLPHGITEENHALQFLEKLLLSDPSLAHSQYKNSGKAKPARTIEEWMRLMFPNQVCTRPALLGRKGFLDDYEILICNEYFQVSRRNRIKDLIRSAFASIFHFIVTED